jgi:hypothetical protein
MFNHKYKRFNADNFKKTVHTERLLFKDWTYERNKMARGGDEMRLKSEASDEIWKRGYNWKPTRERSDETRSGESRGIAVRGQVRISDSP